jgi:hypothetical protein
MDKDKCIVPYCRAKAELTYLRKRVCQKCWGEHCDGVLNLNEVA